MSPATLSPAPGPRLSRRAGVGLLLALACLVAGCPASPENAELDYGSPGRLVIEGASPTTFNGPSSTVRFRAVGATLAPDGDPPVVLVNGRLLPREAVLVTADAIALPDLALDERTDIEVLAWDSEGGELVTATTLWTGSNALEVSVVDESGQPMSGATIRASLGADRTVFAEATSAGGKARFANLPARTIALDARASDNRFASLPTIGAAGTVALRFVGWSPASSVDNNDFHDGAAGWTASNPSALKLVPHQQEDTSSLSFRTETSSTDMDLALQTLGIGSQTLSRTFTVKPGTKAATLRYRFLTSEVPGGYFGTRYDDYFTVTLRSKASGHIVQEENSMNAMGLSAFSASGATSWREIPLLVDPGDTIQVDISVANVADGLYDSSVVVDMIQERSLVIPQLALADIDGAKLEYLSASAHPYFGGATRVYGTLRLEGAKGDTVEYVHLDVLQRGQLTAVGDLVPQAANTLLRKFGDDEKLEIATTGPLFAITSAQLEAIDGAKDGTVSLRVTARSAKGEVAVADVGAVPILVRYTGTNRYGPADRDGDRGGDDWVRPSVKTYLDHFSSLGVPGFVIGDASNMNGGSFWKPHKLHTGGQDADLWFEGYNELDANTAAVLREMLDDPTHGTNMAFVVVTYPAKKGQAFFDAIDGVKLADGRLATTVIRSETKRGDHKTHFHVRFR